MTVPNELKGVGVVREGWLTNARRIASQNFDERPPSELVSLLVVHAISLPPGQFGSDDVIRLFTNALDPDAHPYFAEVYTLRVSAHFLIRRDGELIQFVSCDKRAWHAGVSCWNGRSACNDYSIGIELEGGDEFPFDDAQYVCLAELIAALRVIFPIDSVAAHSEISPGRKTDPGPYFEWPRLARAIAGLMRMS